MIDPHTTRQSETAHGTPYEIWKWTCPKCSQERSTLYIDDEWCHGDTQCTTFGPEKTKDGKWVTHSACGHCVRAGVLDAPNAKVSGAGTASAGLPGYAGDNNGVKK